MSDMILYERVIALNDQRHAQLRVRPPENHAFAARTNSIPILHTEFFDCAREYPIVFVISEGHPVPAALLGLRDNENLCVDFAGKWDARYIPAFVRRYPFVPGKGENGQLLVCIDEASDCFSERDGEPLFVDGKPSATLTQAMRFLADFHQIAQTTEQLGRRLGELALLKPADSLARLNDGSQFRLNGLHVIDEAKLAKLDSATVYPLFQDGSLGMIHAHLISLGHLGALGDRLGRRAMIGKPARQH